MTFPNNKLKTKQFAHIYCVLSITHQQLARGSCYMYCHLSITQHAVLVIYIAIWHLSIPQHAFLVNYSPNMQNFYLHNHQSQNLEIYNFHNHSK